MSCNKTYKIVVYLLLMTVLSGKDGFNLRTEHVVNLIKAHCERDDEKFKQTIEHIAKDEIKKGNQQVAKKIYDAYTINTSPNKERIEKEYQPSSGLVTYTPSTLIAPKDKVNNFDLYEIISPNVNTSNLLLSKQISNKLQFIIDEYKQKQTLQKMGLPFENRLLLCGPPGCGKTSTAFYISKQLGLPLAYVRLDSLISSLLGQTGANIRKIFDSVNGREVVLFLDEFDAIAKKRDDKLELGELKRVVNSLLQNIDMLSSDVFIIAATNHEKLLDPAVWRRFNSSLYLDLPDSELRQQYIQQTLLNYKVESKVDVKKIANLMNGLSFSQINEIIIQAVKKTLFHDKLTVLKTDDLMAAVADTLLLSTSNSTATEFELINKLRQNGLPLRVISELLNIPRTTLSERLKKEKETNHDKQ